MSVTPNPATRSEPANGTVRVEEHNESFVVIFRDALGRDWSCFMRDWEEREEAEKAAEGERHQLRARGVIA